MGFFRKLSGKNKTGIIADFSKVNPDEKIYALRCLHEIFYDYQILYYTDNDKIRDAVNTALNAVKARVNNMSERNLTGNRELPKIKFTNSINLFGTPEYLELLKIGEFDWVTKPFLFTDNISEAKKYLDWPVLKEPTDSEIKKLHDEYSSFLKRLLVDRSVSSTNIVEFYARWRYSIYMLGLLEKIKQQKPLFSESNEMKEGDKGTQIGRSLYLIKSYHEQKK